MKLSYSKPEIKVFCVDEIFTLLSSAEDPVAEDFTWEGFVQ